jgi:hypothetical protein
LSLHYNKIKTLPAYAKAKLECKLEKAKILRFNPGNSSSANWPDVISLDLANDNLLKRVNLA